jgi:ketosteroid isomerase-like protein
MDSNYSEVSELLDNWLDASRAKDIDRLMSLYSADITYYDVVPPLRFAGRDEVRGNFLRWFDEYDGAIDLEPHDMTVVTSANVAFANLLVADSGTRNNGVEGTAWVRATVCCQRSSDGWFITHEHISMPGGWAITSSEEKS